MKKVLVIGSAVTDVIITLDHLPVTGEDVNVISQNMSLGGCAYNVSDMIRHFGVPYIPFFPVGTGAFGDFVRKQFVLRGITTPIPAPDRENGCCYCFVEKNGERTFIAHHGAEYLFRKEWFDLIDSAKIGSVYICGLEIEEETGTHIVEYLEAHPEFDIYFAPGPRLEHIQSELMQRLFAAHPVIHLNRNEALAFSHADCVSGAARFIYSLTGNSVIVTLGKDGCYYYTGTEEAVIPARPAEQIDTIGAGDAHIGTIIAALRLGRSLPEAITLANLVSARVVETQGALLTDEAFSGLSLI